MKSQREIPDRENGICKSQVGGWRKVHLSHGGKANVVGFVEGEEARCQCQGNAQALSPAEQGTPPRIVFHYKVVPCSVGKRTREEG